MKQRIHPTSETEFHKAYPIERNVDGWRFRCDEIANGSFLAQGSDCYGRQVSRQGEDRETVLADCEADAREISQRLGQEL